jgi:hypothetical protein
VWKKNISSNSYSPILDQTSPIRLQYKTNTLVDPNLTFSSNTPLAPITIDVPATYPTSSIPIVVRYDPSAYEVNTGPLSQTVTVRPGTSSGSNIRFVFEGVFSGTGTFPFDFSISVEVYKWDPAANSGQGQYVSYSPANRVSYRFSGSVPYSGGSITVSAASVFPVLTTWQCAYGDALKVSYFNHNPMTTIGKYYRELSSDVFIDPKLTSQFSCAGLVRHEYFRNDSQYLGGLAFSSAIGEFYSLKSIITEDFDVTLAPNSDIEIYVKD